MTDLIDMPNLLYYFGIMENSRWFIFNIADIAISIGAVIFVLSNLTIFEKHEDSSESTLA